MLSRQERQNLVSVLDVAIPAPTLSDTCDVNYFLFNLDRALFHWSYSCNSGEQNELSLLENLHPLTPQIAEDVEDTQALNFINGNSSGSSSTFEFALS
ncbi:hypothetical protein HN51_006772 [Arachis hypogaea]